MPCIRLTLDSCPNVKDLEPLRGIALKRIWLAGTKVTSLEPLRGMKLNFLQISGTAVADLEPLRGMPLRDLKMTDCRNITDLGPITEMTTLQTVILPPNARNVAALRANTNLTHISFKYDPVTKGPAQTAAEFWAEFDKRKAARE